jgi:uncharacterized membrane protein YidH (DUF202 family)
MTALAIISAAVVAQYFALYYVIEAQNAPDIKRVKTAALALSFAIVALCLAASAGYQMGAG